MADYRRANQPGGTYFFTLVTYNRRPLFAEAENVDRLRSAVLTVMNDRPFEFLAGVVLPDHAHYLWALPPGDSDFSTRIGRIKVQFTKSLHANGGQCPPYIDLPTRSPSRIKHREADVWQRRFWEHLIRDEEDLHRHLDYIHYNPVKHGVTNCPHAWPASSFERWATTGCYDRNWCCQCTGDQPQPPDFSWACDDME